VIGNIYKNGNVAVPMREYEKVQEENLKTIKYDQKEITDFKKVSAYNPSVRFKNVMRKNEDGSFDIIIDPSVHDEVPTGFLPLRAYKALHFRKREKNPLMPLTSVYTDFNIITVSSPDIISQFNLALDIKEVETLLEESIKKGVKYYG